MRESERNPGRRRERVGSGGPQRERRWPEHVTDADRGAVGEGRAGDAASIACTLQENPAGMPDRATDH
jgi:hypothetical protein